MFFRHTFTSALPYASIHVAQYDDLAIPVTKLSHVTHNKEAQDIKQTATFRFTQKMGKVYDYGFPMGESFRDDFFQPGGEMPENLRELNYKYIPWWESVMPQGFYSWWGLAADCLVGLQHPVLLDKRKYETCPPYLQDPPSSLYGNQEFSGDLHQVLLWYRNARSDYPNNPAEIKPDVYLLLGGTLRYSYEICCVVIVCTEHDRNSEALKHYRPIPHFREIPDGHSDPVLLLGGLTDHNGRVKDFTATTIPQFYPRFISGDASWASLAFAFYHSSSEKLPFDSHEFRIRCGHITHLEERCLKKKSAGNKGLCPNKLPLWA